MPCPTVTRREALALAGTAATAAVATASGCDSNLQGSPITPSKITLIESIGDTSGWNATYYGTDATADEVRDAALEVAYDLEAGGSVLLANDGTLPLAPQTPISLLGRGAAEPVFGGTGAALIDTAACLSLVDALEATGLVVNRAPLDWAAAHASDYPRAKVGALDKPETVSHYLGEIPWDAYPEDVRASIAGTVGVVVIGRPSGEGADLSTDLLASLASGVSETFVANAETGNYAEGQHQLELCAEELGLLAAAREACSAVVVLLNTATTMEVGPLVEPAGAASANALVHIGFPGTVGMRAVADVLTGATNPSGRTCDLWASDLTATPSFKNFGNYTYSDVTDYYTSIGSGAHFVEYEEGIYVGYRYYETAHAEAEAGNYEGFSYDAAVTFPFGFGLSYTTFDRELLSVEKDGALVMARMRVTNTGSVAGRDVVQLYVTPPASSSANVEKSAVSLVAFDKTDELAPGDDATLTLWFAVRDLASYDVTQGAYVLDAGDYEVSLRTDSHTPVGSEVISLDAETFATDSATGAPIKNRFDDVTSYMEANCTQLTRRDFAGTFPDQAHDKTAAEVGVELHEYDALAAQNPDDEMPLTREKNGLSLIDLRGRAMDDPLWDRLLDQMVPSAMKAILCNSTYGTGELPSVGKPQTFEGDGPAGIAVYVDAGDGVGTGAHCGYPSEYLVAQTWDAPLVHQMGEAIGDEFLLTGINGWCAPALNCHRSPFGGRNFEYYSEDPLLAGTLACEVVEGAFTRGVYAQLKHFCLNDQDTNRCAHLLTWANEQAIREIYARPFEIVVKTARGQVPYLDDASGKRLTRDVSAAMGIMSSYNYVGDTWAGGRESLCTGLLRDEWGYGGYVVSDWTLYDYTNKNQGFYAGTDVMFTNETVTGEIDDATSATAVKALRQAMHRYLYVIANSNAMNGEAPTVRVTYA